MVRKVGIGVAFGALASIVGSALAFVLLTKQHTAATESVAEAVPRNGLRASRLR
jgi:hypothetical protein